MLIQHLPNFVSDSVNSDDHALVIDLCDVNEIL